MEDERFFFLINGSGSGLRLSLEKQSKVWVGNNSKIFRVIS